MSTAVPVTQVEICNIALGLLGTSRIQSMYDSSAGAVECKARFPLSFNHVLRIHPWQFATNHALLTQLTESVPPGWSYVFQAPADSMLVRRVYDANGDNVPYNTYRDRILCNDLGVWAEYTRKVDPVTVPQEVGMAIACHLAFCLAPVLSHSGQNSRDVLYQMYEREISKARFTSAAESGPIHTEGEDWGAARYRTLGGL